MSTVEHLRRFVSERQTLRMHTNPATMSTVEHLRRFVSERLSAAAEEILGVFGRTVVEYEEEIQRQRVLLDVVLKPEVKLYRIDQLVCKAEEHHTEQQPRNQERISSLDQEEPEPPQIKEEPEELRTVLVGEQSVAKQEDDASSSHPTYQLVCKEEVAHTEQQPSNQWGISTQNYFHSKVLPLVLNGDQNGAHRDQRDTTYLDRKEPELPQIKEEPEEFCTHLQGEQSALKQEDDAIISNVTINKREFFPLGLNADQIKDDIDGSDAMETFPSELKSEPNTFLPSTSSDKRYSCGICGKSFSHHSSLKRHAVIHTDQRVRKEKDVVAGRISSQAPNHNEVLPPTFIGGQNEARRNESVTRERSQSESNGKTEACDVCGKTFSKKSRLNIHMRVHTGEKPYPCGTCGRSFSQITSMKMHAATHANDKPYPCSVCGKEFSLKVFLKTHMRTHTGDRPYPCSTCGKCFLQKGHLNIHTRIHTGERPFSCSTCGKTFLQKSNLTVHLRRSPTCEQP